MCYKVRFGGNVASKVRLKPPYRSSVDETWSRSYDSNP